MHGNYVVTGVVVGVHGIKGELKVKVLTDFPERFDVGNNVLLGDKDFTNIREFKIEKSRYHKKVLILKLVGLDDRTSAEYMRGFLCLTDSPYKIKEKDRFYVFDIEGLNVFDLDNRLLGAVKEVASSPNNDIYIVEGESGEFMIPALKIFIKDIDIAKKSMHVDMEKLNGAD